MTTRFIIIITIVLLFNSCANKDVNTVEQLYADIILSYESEDYDATKFKIDSLHSIFPKKVEFRKKCDTIEWKMSITLSEKEVVKNDSIIQNSHDQLFSLQKEFNYDKDEKYEDVGSFIYKSLDRSKNAQRIYLQPSCDETGSKTITSFYFGKKIKHHTISISDGTTFTETINASDYLHTFDDGGGNKEILTINDKNLNNVFEYIADNTSSNITIKLIGSNTYEYKMTANDLKAFKQTNKLANTLYLLDSLQSEQKKLHKQLITLTTKLNRL